MAKITGHSYTRDPYPWDGAETLAGAAAWTCCDMNLPSTFITCPMCDKERDVKRADGDSHDHPHSEWLEESPVDCPSGLSSGGSAAGTA